MIYRLPFRDWLKLGEQDKIAESEGPSDVESQGEARRGR
jgi:hypothetical protein